MKNIDHLHQELKKEKEVKRMKDIDKKINFLRQELKGLYLMYWEDNPIILFTEDEIKRLEKERLKMMKGGEK